MIFAAAGKLKPYEIEVLLDSGWAQEFVPRKSGDVVCPADRKEFSLNRPANRQSGNLIALSSYSYTLRV